MYINSIIDAQLTLHEYKHNIIVDNEMGPEYPLLYNEKICFVTYNDKVYSVFTCEDKSYIWRKPNTLYLIKDEAYIKLMLQIDNIERQFYEENPSIIKNIN